MQTEVELLERARDIAWELYMEKCRRDILEFTLYTKEDYAINWHHIKLANALNRFVFGDPEYEFLMVFMPPRHGKSELVSRRLPAFIHGHYPDDEIMCASYLDSLAGDMTIDVQKIIDSKEYANVFPGTRIWPPGTSYTKGTRNSAEHSIVGRRGKYRGQGVGGSFTGKGANWIIVDDPIKGREIADSIAFRERLWNFYNNDLFSRRETRLDTGRKGRVLITQTRWHEDDLSGRLIEMMKKDPEAAKFKIVEFPAIRVDMDNPDDPRAMGAALWPAKYDTKALMQIKASAGARAWTSLYQQNPVPDGGGLFKDHMFRYVDLPQMFDYRFITADTTYKEKQENDFTCFSQWGVVGEQLYLINVWMEQIKAVDVEKAVEPFIRNFINYGYRNTWIEPKGHGIYLNQLWKTSEFMIPSDEDLKEFYSDRRFDKVERASNVAPHLANRFVGINQNMANKEDLVAQALGFPKSKHDDFVDTLVDALKVTYNRRVNSLSAFM